VTSIVVASISTTLQNGIMSEIHTELIKCESLVLVLPRLNEVYYNLQQGIAQRVMNRGMIKRPGSQIDGKCFTKGLVFVFARFKLCIYV
jgi:hypothetical protein